jgi:hypothetical protein
MKPETFDEYYRPNANVMPMSLLFDGYNAIVYTIKEVI